MSWKVLVFALLFGVMLGQAWVTCSQIQRVREVTAANAILQEHAAALLEEREAADAATVAREAVHAVLDAGRQEERAAVVRARKDDGFRDWADAALPAVALGLLWESGTGSGDGQAESAGSAAAGHAGAGVE